MRVGVFTPLLASLPLKDAFKKLAGLNIRTGLMRDNPGTLSGELTWLLRSV